MTVLTRGSEIFRWWVRQANTVIIGLQRLGIAFGPQYLITVPGRKTGRPRTAAIAVVPIAGQRYVVQAYPKAAWVANVRAAEQVTLSRGRRSSVVKMVELPVAERRPLLRDCIADSPRVGKLFTTSGLVDDGSPDGVAAAADRIAVFRVEPT